MAAETVQS